MKGYDKSLLEASSDYLYSESWFNVYKNYDFGLDWGTRQEAQAAQDVADEDVIYRIHVKLKGKVNEA